MLYLLVIWIPILIYIYYQRVFQHWKKRGIKGPEPTFFVGNMGAIVSKTLSFGELYDKYYRQFKGEPVVGLYKANDPVLLICDADLVKNMLLTNFKSFHDNAVDIDKKIDPIIGRNPFSLKGQEWKDTRSQLTPTLSLSKVKQMHQAFQRSSKSFVEYLKKETVSNKRPTVQIRNLCANFTLDNVANCCFGVESNSFEHPNSELRQLATNFLDLESSVQKVFSMLLILLPSLFKMFKLKIVSSKVEERLQNIINGTLKYRKEHNLQPKDFLQTMDGLRSPTFTDVDVTAHAASFFADGYETSSWAMASVILFLAKFPEEQERAREEVLQVLEDHKELNTEAIQKLVYLEAFVEETFRIYPPAPFMLKTCTETYTFTSKTSRTVTIEKGTECIIPGWSFAMDPEFFPEPKEFQPERFLGENYKSIPKHVNLTFGAGPRMCLGRNFARQQMKVGLAYLLKDFRFVKSPKMVEPWKIESWFFVNAIKGGLWVDVERV